MTVHIDFPFHFDARGRTAGTDHPDHVRDMIELVLFTTPGERVNRPEFGCGLLDMVFEPNSLELAATLETTARAALQRYLGDVISVEALTVTAAESTLRVELRYLLLATGERQTSVIEGRVGQ